MPHPAARRILLAHDPFVELDQGRLLWERGRWPAKWLRLPTPAPCVAAFRLPLNLDAPATFLLHLSAVERYRLLLDGVEQGLGPERGDARRWRLDSWEVSLEQGLHWLALEVWALGPRAPVWQVDLTPGLLVVGEGPWHARLTTGQAPWQALPLNAYDLEDQPRGFFTGPRAIVRGERMPWGWDRGQDQPFLPAVAGPNATCARGDAGYDLPAMVPAATPPVTLDPLPNGQAVLVDALDSLTLDGPGDTPAADPAADRPDERHHWQQWLDGRSSLTIPAGQTRRCLVDLATYRAFWPSIDASGPGVLRLRFAEGLYSRPDDAPTWGGDKGHRAQWQHRFVRGVGPGFLPVPGPARTYRALEWECGRWMEITARAGSAPVTLHALLLRDTSFPFTDDAHLDADDPALLRLRQLCVHTLRVGTHSHYCDCPYYERLQYIGDTRLEILASYALTRDDRLPRRALQDFAAARLDDGLLPARHPARGVQVIPPFALWWVHMLHDFAMWRNDPALVRRLLPTARGILDAWFARLNADGLIQRPAGWNFVDWVVNPHWHLGLPPGADDGVSFILNWHAAWTARLLAQLEQLHGEPELHALQLRRAAALAQALDAAAWDESRGRYLDAPGHHAVSEHAQCLALLSGLLTPARAQRVGHSLAHDEDLARATIYFTHYLFEACRLLRREDLLWRRLELWFGLDALGFTTTPEQPEPTRSDCHPWGAHPLFHMAATIAGIRPASPGFASVSIDPMPGPLNHLHLRLPHPAGVIDLRWRRGQPLDIDSPVPVVAPR